MPSNTSPTGAWADAGLFHCIATEAARRYPRAMTSYNFESIAPHIPTRTALAPGNLVHELRQACLERVGPIGAFDIFANCFLGRSFPLLMPLLAAPDAPRLVRRLQAVEDLTPRVATTTLLSANETSVDLGQIRNDEAIAATVSYSIGYWAMILGLFSAAGYKDLVLTSLGYAHPITIFTNGALCESSHTALQQIRSARLTWQKRDRVVSPLIQPITSLADSEVIDRIAMAIASAIECGSPPPSLEKLAVLAHRSSRSVQRDLTSSWTTLRDIRTSVRMGRATSMLAESTGTLAEIAFGSGFSDAPHLVREFRRIVGLTPERYRTMYRL